MKLKKIKLQINQYDYFSNLSESDIKNLETDLKNNIQSWFPGVMVETKLSDKFDLDLIYSDLFRFEDMISREHYQNDILNQLQSAINQVVDSFHNPIYSEEELKP